MRLVYIIYLGIAVGIFLWIRSCVDGAREKVFGYEVVREDEELLGIWGNKSERALIYFRLHRDGNFTWKMVEYPKGDTVTRTGTYDVIGPDVYRRTDYYPKLIAVDGKDTLMNFFIAYVTPYDSKVDKVDRLVLSPHGIYDTVSYTFFRLKPTNLRGVSFEDLEKVQAEEEKFLSALAPSHDALTATDLIALADCRTIECVQLFMKDHSNDFFHAAKGEFASSHRSAVVDTAGNELVIPLSTLYVDVNPQASWRMAHTLHRKDLGNNLLEEFKELGFTLADSGYYRGLKGKQARYQSRQFPGKSLYVTSTYSPWYLKGLYQRVTWPCYVFEVRNDQ